MFHKHKYHWRQIGIMCSAPSAACSVRLKRSFLLHSYNHFIIRSLKNKNDCYQYYNLGAFLERDEYRMRWRNSEASIMQIFFSFLSTTKRCWLEYEKIRRKSKTKVLRGGNILCYAHFALFHFAIRKKAKRLLSPLTT